jgi:ketosteroid isomerase-like protein
VGNDTTVQAAQASDVAWLRDHQAIKDRLLRYADAVDRRDWATVGATFSDDAVVAGLVVEKPIAPYLEFLETSVEVYAATMHVFSNQLIDLEPGADTAKATTYAVAYHLEAPETGKEDLVVGLIYHDTFGRRDGEWVVTHRRTESKWIKGPLPTAD